MKKRMEFLYRGVALLLAALLMLSDLTVIASAVVEDMESQQVEQVEQVEQQVEETEQMEVTVCDVCGMEECVCPTAAPEEESVEESVEESAEEVVEEIPVEEEAMEEEAPMLFALSPMDVPVIENNGSRLVASSADAPMYQWQISSTADGTYTDIDGATSRYYDITAADEGKYIKAVVDGVETEVVGPIGKLVEFDIAKGSITFNTDGSYSGKNSVGSAVSGTHTASNIYVVKQSNNSTFTKNNITFAAKGEFPNDPFDITLDGVNMYQDPTNTKQNPGTSGSNTPDNGKISIPAYDSGGQHEKHVTLRLKGENQVRNITYYNGGDTQAPATVNSELKITDINGDGATDGGSLYMPRKLKDAETIESFVASQTNYNHWNAVIGGTDGTSLVQNLHIAGGTLQVLSTLGDNCTAIGAGGNGYCDIKITGGNITAHCNGTGTAIGGGIGWNAAGGPAEIKISGGSIYAKNHAEIYVKVTYNDNGTVKSTSFVENVEESNQVVGGVAIGGGSSFHEKGSYSNVTIEGGTVKAYGTFGNGLGGGNSSTKAGGNGEITISGSTVDASSIGGGNSRNGDAGEATVTVSQSEGRTTTVTLIKGIGGGTGGISGGAGSGGAATITVNGGTMTCGDSIGGGNGNGAGKVGGKATITVNGGTLTAKSVGGGTGGSGDTSGAGGNGGEAVITVKGGSLECSGTIGGGTGGDGTIGGTGGKATITVNGGTLTAQSIGGGTASSNGNGGAATITVTDGTIRTGTIGGGTLPGGNTVGKLGYATAKISGGDICGQFLLAAGTDRCTFTMTGGKISGVNTADTSTYTYASLDGGAVYMDDSDGTVTISGGEITDCTAQNGGAVYLKAGVCTISGTANIHDNTATANGGAVYLGGGTMNVDGGTIKGNTAAANGGAAYIAAGNFNMTDGTMGGAGTEDGNSAVNGGAVYVENGNFAMSGGTIEGNTATNNGGAAYVNNGSFTMTSGTITSNTATTDGGGVYVGGGTVTVGVDSCIAHIHPVFSGNKALNGGAIAVAEGTPIMYCGSFIGNTATSNGGSVYVGNGGFIMHGGTMGGAVPERANTAVKGGAVYVTTGTFEMNNGSLIGNSASDSGGAVYVAGGSFTMSDGMLIGNSATANGGAAYVAGNFTMTNGTIGGTEDGTANTAGKDGGAVYVNSGTFAMSNGAVSGNIAEQNGGGIAVNNGKIIMSGGAVSGNKAKGGDGGGMYVSSVGASEVAVKIYSGQVLDNTAAISGGAVAVEGGESSKITVHVGVNKLHTFDGEGKLISFEHTEGSEGTYTHSACPVIAGNISQKNGGAFYITGGKNTHLDMYCLTDSGDNKTHGDDDVLGNSMSDFLMVEGGTVYITTSKETGDAAGKDDYTTTDDTLGHTTIKGSIHIIGGVLELFGSKTNPEVQGSLTIDLTKESDKYIDHREADGIVTISYHENFTLDGANEVTQTAFDVKDKDTHSIHSSMYAHEGYTFLGWNSNENAKKGDNSGHWFETRASYTFHLTDEDHTIEGTVDGKNVYGDIIIYAIWEPNGYYVEYLPGVPDGEEWYGEIKDNGARYTYATEYKYAENGFVYPGYKFGGWSVPNKGIQQPGATFLNLTSTQGATVPVTAQWVECDHPDGKITYTVEGSTITKTCDQCKLTATATLSAEDATYDGNRHEAWLTLSNKTFWNPGEIQYEGVTLNPVDTLAGLPNGGEPIEGDKLCVNAGNYTATITAPGEKSVLVEYTIKKKPTPAPTNRPSYIRPESGTTLTINTLPEGERQSAVSGAYATYVVRYHKDGEQNRVVRDNTGKEATVSYTLPEALKTYTVLAYYPETENYAASSMIAADTTLLFAGDLYLTIRVDSGIDYRLTMEQETELRLRVLDGFYLVGGEYNIKKEITNEDSDYNLEKLNFAKQPDVVEEEGVAWVVYRITAETAAKRTDVSVFVGDTKRTPGMSVEVKEKEVFRDFTNNNPVTIAQDSAFTAKCTVTGYDVSVYEKMMLNVPMPEGTSIILRDLDDESYWYYTAESNLASVSLDSFMRMGKSVEKYTRSDDLRLLFVVDYADATTKPNIEKVTLSLSAGTKTGMVGIEDMPIVGKEVTLAKVSLALSSAAEPTTGLTQTVTVSASNTVAASRYDHRDVALVLSLASAETAMKQLPIDAAVNATVKGMHSTRRPDKNGYIIIPLGDFAALSNSESITLELSSDMFPVGVEQYTLSAQLYLSPTDADTSPMNGETMGDPVDLTFTSQRDETGIKICVPNDQRLFTIGSSITAQVEYSSELKTENIDVGYNVNVELHWEIDNGFANTAIAPTRAEANNAYVFDLSKAQRGGNYCIVATLAADNGYVLNEARYYFILQEASEEDPTQGPTQGTNQEGSDPTGAEQGTTENP